MNNRLSILISELLEDISFGDGQNYNGITLFPLMNSMDAIQYITLKEAYENQLIKISEISDSGSVPELNVVNLGQKNILLIDGEELAGAKQNRIINTSIMIPIKGDLVIPVSCTEEGRWSYNTPTFYDSDELATSSIRASKVNNVSNNLNNHMSYASDQSDIWNNIRAMRNKDNISSRTGSMKDVYDHKRTLLDMITGHFPIQKGQKGLMVYYNNKFIGLDVFSSETAYQQYHKKLLRSYMISIPNSNASILNNTIDIDTELILKNIKACNEKIFRSNGVGNDHRYTGYGMVGLMLSVENQFIHAAFFNDQTDLGCNQPTGKMYRGHRYN